MDDSLLGAPRPEAVRTYRRVAMAVVASYLGLDDAFVEAALEDRMDEYLCHQDALLERLKRERYDDYVALLSREILVQYAAAAAEGLAAAPDSPQATQRLLDGAGDDDLQAMARVHELFAPLECPDAGEEAERILRGVKRHLCHYYHACAYDLVRGDLLSALIDAADEWCRGGCLRAERIRELIIARQ